jgi:aminocarboxymuconate-semialdehyde decarboxylase
MIVDMHAHYVSPALIAEAEAHGARYGVSIATLDTGLKQLTFMHSGERLRPFLPELISLDLRKPWLAKHGIDVQVVSTWTDMNGDDLPIEQSKAWVRLQNETLAADSRASGGRYVAMGTLALGSVELAIAELDYMSRQLGLRAIELGTNFNGIDLDDPQFRPVWRKIADLGMLVLLHPPFKPVGLERARDYFLNNLISYPVDTTIAAARLIFSGILDEFSGLNVCLAHAGGFLPYQIGRMNCGFGSHPACSRAIAKAPDQYLSSFFYDTLTHDDAALGYLSRRVGNDRLFYGSDYPFEMLDPSGPSRVKAMSGIAAADAEAILSGNICDVMGIAMSDTAQRASA